MQCGTCCYSIHAENFLVSISASHSARLLHAVCTINILKGLFSLSFTYDYCLSTFNIQPYLSAWKCETDPYVLGAKYSPMTPLT